ncbi:methyl-accepting chemotaxis protein [Synechococcus sp. PCC 7502]|uniref:methyl-accepting chemotaxis protein n=1 Tax=Synechococcus sp. PCC 7502 TaxID=1173263 RepID=UPI00029F96DC|nr:methyl-accepting chemotaxis protein [Synechococcus sp. PCC 7502]AFY74174.1 methyl-accepting chemotaxis protein [Synechococcus sp. PCC 7502]
MLNNLNLKQRLLFGYSVPIVLFVILGVTYFISVSKRQALEVESTKSLDIERSVNQFTIGASGMIRTVRGQLLYPEDDFQPPFQYAYGLLKQERTKLKENLKDPQFLVSEQVSFMISEADRLEKIAIEAFQLIKDRKLVEAKSLVRTFRIDNFIKAREAIIAKDDEVLKKLKDEQEAVDRFILILSLLGTLLATIFAMAIALLFIGKSVEGVSQAARTVAASAAEIAATVEQQERSIAQQAASVNQTTTTVEELGVSSRQSAQQADASAAGAKAALAITEDGLRAVEKTTEGLNNLKEKVRAIAEQIMRLSEQTGQISGVTAVVADIANQTNMLALNAAVEAARAGEQGKGFAVVASEIRKLADESKKSAERIYQLVSDVQAAMNSTVMVTDEGTKTADASILLAQGTTDAFNSVTEAINSVFLNNQQIALGSKQQAVGVQQVISAMNAINLGSKEAASGMSQVKVSASSLNTVAKELQALT